MKKFYKLMAAILALCLVTALGACGNNDDDNGDKGGVSTYTMEAEYIDLDDVVGAGISSEQAGVNMIFGDATDAQKTKGWSNGYFVGFTYSTSVTLNFVFESDRATTATIILRLGSELGNINLDPSSFAVKLNDTAINYASMYIENSLLSDMKFTDKTVSATAPLVKGQNTVSLVVLANTLRNGQTGGPTVDCIKIKSAAKLTWTDKTDNPGRRGEI